MIIRLLNGSQIIGPDQLSSHEVDFAGTAAVEGDDDPGWGSLSSAVNMGTELIREPEEADRVVLQALCENISMSKRDAGDPKVWHYPSVLLYREFIQRRWFDARSSLTTEDRLLGNIRRNALAHLWWTAETLGERLCNVKPLCDELYRGDRSRLRLWLIDFEPFYGRPDLARITAQYCISEKITKGSDVDRFFHALGAIAAVAEIDMYLERPEKLFSAANDFLLQIA